MSDSRTKATAVGFRALVSAATWKASEGSHFVESSRIREPSG